MTFCCGKTISDQISSCLLMVLHLHSVLYFEENVEIIFPGMLNNIAATLIHTGYILVSVLSVQVVYSSLIIRLNHLMLARLLVCFTRLDKMRLCHESLLSSLCQFKIYCSGSSRPFRRVQCCPCRNRCSVFAVASFSSSF